jgi:hypothetical protein
MKPSYGAQPSGDPTPSTCNTTNDPLPFNIDAMSNILTMALACDLTRVASLQMSQALSPATHVWLPSNQTKPQQTHHQWSHVGPTSWGNLITCSSATTDPCGADPLYTVTPAEATSMVAMGGQPYPQQLVDIDAWYAMKVANLAAMLASTPSKVSGKSLLDVSAICWGSELDMGNFHNHDDTPFVIIGGANGKLNTGQLVRFPLNLSAPYYTAGNKPPTNNRFHNDLLATLAQVMGVGSTIPTFGDATVAGSILGAPSAVTLNQGVITQILT